MSGRDTSKPIECTPRVSRSYGSVPELGSEMRPKRACVIGLVSTDSRMIDSVRKTCRRLHDQFGASTGDESLRDGSTEPVGVLSQRVASALRAVMTESDELTCLVGRDLDELSALLNFGGPKDLLHLILDLDSMGELVVAPEKLAEQVDRLRTHLSSDVGWTQGGLGIRGYVRQLHLRHLAEFMTFPVFELPETPEQLEAQLCLAIGDSVQFGRLCVSDGGEPERIRTLMGGLVVDLMNQIFDEWDLRYYTGSLVAVLIEDLESRCRDAGHRSFRSANEHGLAAGALARWEIDGVPSVIVVTSGMLDELKGTLSNLRAARVPAVIICADGRDRSWFGFQSTRTADEDIFDVLQARRISAIRCERASTLHEDLSLANELIRRGDGPVVLLAVPEVLEAVAYQGFEDGLGRAKVSCLQPANTMSPQRDSAQAIKEILEDPRRRVILQPGRLEPDERELVQGLAEQAGIALVDSLNHPGSVAGFCQGVENDFYLGTLGLYGFSDSVQRFCYTDGKLAAKDELTIIFLKSRVGEIATPFSESAMRRKIHVVQVTREPNHCSPAADVTIVASARQLLAQLQSQVSVDDNLRSRRIKQIYEAKAGCDVGATVESCPMTVNYFYRRLAALMTDLIRDCSYEYTGVFEVGRAGLSAIRALPRTGPGFSGWYGRAAMGDALQAIPSIALARDRNVVAIAGEGALMLVPSMLPAFIEHFMAYGHKFQGNVVLFVVWNGGHSMIQSYMEGRLGYSSRRQMMLPLLVPEQTQGDWGAFAYRRELMLKFDEQRIKEALQCRGTITVFDIVLGHTNGGGGVSLLDSMSWRNGDLDRASVLLAQERKI